ncbi:4-hydroxybenzoate polyprenyltransferase [Alteribacillus persepolensis]|uniref:4-hydroxybenzoate polyprenyltransferase n=1 Tax=Alteribacillus persepolensis TaxID=568899 RepID=A0A1G7ZGH5_9BACI|nr:UbiA-like polyprenyltransferase [Alteribacillus persepolensis]SDH07784.1 4-hydroxybenzoate polyprenyltransferase [Alteribacillus persepolensis]
MRKIKIILEMIKFEHTVFALPFAFLGAVLGSLMVEGTWPTIAEWIWITLAMVGARSAAMTLNRVIDVNIDKKNPRTADRAIPAGLISISQSMLFITASFLLLFVSAYQLNMLSVYLLPIAVFLLAFYSYTKRFTWLCHVFLGITIAIAPLGGWVGTTGTLQGEAFLLFFAVAFWVAGFDIIYATQDADYDRKEGLYSIPSKFGIKKALYISRAFHSISFVSLLILHVVSPLSMIYLAGVLIAGVVMTYEHSMVKPHDLTNVKTAFFPMNGIISMVMLFFTIGDVLI